MSEFNKFRLLKVNPQLLVEVLKLPEGTVIDFATCDETNIIFRVRHTDFTPLAGDGSKVPEINVVCSTEGCEWDVDTTPDDEGIKFHDFRTQRGKRNG